MNNLQKNANTYISLILRKEEIMGRRDFFEERKLKRLVYVFAITLIISIIAFVTIFIMYNNKLKQEANKELLNLGKINDIVPNDDLNPVSSTSDKDISDVKNTTKTNTIKKEKVSKTAISSKVTNTTNTIKNTANNNVQNNVTNQVANTIENTNQVKEELKFCAPVSGEIIKDFATDTLIYSNTLEEWTTHTGIDIKSNKTTIVVASEKGIVESIKTDPRYGLTITISHENGFKTMYSNLLTTEFVTEGENVEKGQTIGTVGESSSFEIADEPHLHFEMYKDGILVNPTIYLKDI